MEKTWRYFHFSILISMIKWWEYPEIPFSKIFHDFPKRMYFYSWFIPSSPIAEAVKLLLGNGNQVRGWLLLRRIRCLVVCLMFPSTWANQKTQKYMTSFFVMPGFCFDDTKELRCWSMKFHEFHGAQKGKLDIESHTGKPGEDFTHLYIPKDVGRCPKSKSQTVESAVSCFQDMWLVGVVSNHIF